MIASPWRIAFGIVTAILLAAFVVQVAGSAVSFDGAMNLQVAASLADGHGYARFYDEWILFPEEVQTNAPFILPASLVFALFGVSLVSAQIVPIAYVMALVVAIIWLVRPAAGGIVALAATSLVLLSPEFSRFAANGYGEVPGLFWFLLGLGFLCRALDNERTHYYSFAGLCLGFAVLTKTVILMPAGLALGLAGVTLMLGRRWRALAVGAIAFLAPIAAFEAWRAVSLGGVVPWSGWWDDQIQSILAQAGVRNEFQNTPIWTEKLLTHASILADHLSIPLWLVPVLALIPMGLALMMFGELKKPDRSTGRFLLLAALALSITAYLIWWLLITPTEKAWHRRIFNGLLLLAIAAPVVFDQALRSLRKRSLLALVAALPVLTLIHSGLANFKLDSADDRASAIREAAQFMHNQPPNARFYGLGWYSAPVLSLYSGRHIHDLLTWKHLIEPDERSHYLLVDTNMIQSGAHEQALRGLDHRSVIDEYPWARVVEITGGFRFTEMPAFDTDKAAVHVDFLQSKYKLVQGFHPPEGEGWRWVEPAARIALKRSEEARLVVDGYVPSLDKYRIADSGDTISIEAVAGNCALGTRRIEQSGNFELSWPLGRCPGPGQEVVIITLRASATIKGVDRPLAWIAHSIGFFE